MLLNTEAKKYQALGEIIVSQNWHLRQTQGSKDEKQKQKQNLSQSWAGRMKINKIFKEFTLSDKMYCPVQQWMDNWKSEAYSNQSNLST